MNKLEDMEKICVDQDRPTEGKVDYGHKIMAVPVVKDHPREVFRIVFYNDGSTVIKTDEAEVKGTLELKSLPLIMIMMLTGGLKK